MLSCPSCAYPYSNQWTKMELFHFKWKMDYIKSCISYQVATCCKCDFTWETESSNDKMLAKAKEWAGDSLKDVTFCMPECWGDELSAGLPGYEPHVMGCRNRPKEPRKCACDLQKLMRTGCVCNGC